MGWETEDGTPIPDATLNALVDKTSSANPVRTWPQIASQVGGIAKRNVPAIGAQTLGQMGGEALGEAALAPETGGASLIPLLLGVLGAGAGNVAANKLPPEYGGNPDESNTSAFLWGAGPAAVGLGTTKGIGRLMDSRAAQGSADAAEDFEKAAGDTSKQQAGIVEQGIRGEGPTIGRARTMGRQLGSVSGLAAPALEGEERTQATNEATDAVLGPINRMRRKLGEPIGNLYKSLKADPTPLAPEEIGNLQSAAQGVRDSMISRYPKAKAILAQIKALSPPEKPAFMTSADPNVIPRAVTPDDFAAQEKYLEAKKNYKPPTWDDIRELRQANNTALRSATGGDAHAMLNLQQQLDDMLMDKLPGIGPLRNSYRGFIKNYDWRDINKLRASGTPDQVGDWFFNRDKSVVNEVIRNAKPAERDTYRELFAQRALSKVDPNLPAAQQEKAIRDAVAPAMKNGTFRLLYGDRSYSKMLELTHAPAIRAEVADTLKSPAGQKLWADGFMDAAKRSGKADRNAAEAGYNAWINSLPPEQQAIAKRYVQPSAPIGELPVLPNSQQALASHLKANPAKGYFPRFAMGSAAGSAGLALAGGSMGSPFMLRAALGFGLLSGGAAGWNALMQNGGAEAVSKMYSSPAARKAGSAAFRALVTMGGRAIHQETQQEEAIP
jgi:hypothetical protein